MAYYNTPIRLLRRVREAEAQGNPFMTVERAVHRVTGELASWFDIDAGKLRVGDRADIAIIDPTALDASVDAMYEAPMPKFPGLVRMVNRSSSAVSATVIAGEVVFENETFAPEYGKTRRTGSFLPVGKLVLPTLPAAAKRPRAA
jgi:N-acyl-D-aspartate/D-glutamate deacylase